MESMQTALLGSSAAWFIRTGHTPTKSEQDKENVVSKETDIRAKYPAIVWDFPYLPPDNFELTMPFRLYVSFKYGPRRKISGKTEITHYYKITDMWVHHGSGSSYLKWPDSHPLDIRDAKGFIIRNDTGENLYFKTEFLTDGRLYPLNKPRVVSDFIDARTNKPVRDLRPNTFNYVLDKP